MGQIEVYEFLKDKRALEDTYFSVKQVCEGLRERGFSNGILQGVRGDLLRLEWAGYLEVRYSNKFDDWLRLWRLKKKYV